MNSAFVNNVAVLGAGGWGIAIARLLYENGYRPSLWEFDPEVAPTLTAQRELPAKLPGIKIPNEITITSDLSAATREAEIICFVIPSQFVRATTARMSSLSLRNPILVNFAKGIENTTLMRMSEIIERELDGHFSERVVTVSGPSHAEEVARRLPTTVVAASNSLPAAVRVQELLSNDVFRVYTNDDIIGVELAGSLKNVIAIAAGIVDGLELGDNTKGALLTRGLAEISRLGEHLGAEPLTFAGLAGIGDLITTCMSKHSRNRYVGEQIGRGKTTQEVLGSMTMVAEGVKTTQAAVRLAERLGVEMPITQEVNRVLFENKSPATALQDLMGRQLKPETWG